MGRCHQGGDQLLLWLVPQGDVQGHAAPLRGHGPLCTEMLGQGFNVLLSALAGKQPRLEWQWGLGRHVCLWRRASPFGRVLCCFPLCNFAVHVISYPSDDIFTECSWPAQRDLCRRECSLANTRGMPWEKESYSHLEIEPWDELFHQTR